MTLYKLTGGVHDGTANTKLSVIENSNIATSLRSNTNNLIRQLQDRSVVFSADGGEWAEAYIDADGQKDSVDTALTTAIDCIGEYAVGTSNIDATVYTITTTGFTTVVTLTVGDVLIYKKIPFEYRSTNAGDAGQRTVRFVVTYTDTSSENLDFTFNATPTSYTLAALELSNPEKTVDTIAVQLAQANASADGDIKNVNYLTSPASALIITHDLPSGSFSSTISSCFGSALVAQWGSSGVIKYKLTNATEDTGWLTYNEVGTFTAFTSEPTKCITELSGNFIGIKGFGVLE